MVRCVAHRGLEDAGQKTGSLLSRLPLRGNWSDSAFDEDDENFMMTSEGLYDILGAAQDASSQELKSCYQRAVLKCHPDKLPPTCSEAERAAALQRFHLVDTAWRTLGDEASRKEYDARQTEKEMRKPWPLNEKVHVDEMDWQEDEEVYSYSCRCGGEYVVTVKDIDQNVSIVGCNTCTLSIELVQGGSSEVQIGNSVQPT